MNSVLVNCTTLDSVRIDAIGEGRALTIPARVMLDLDGSLRQVRECRFSLIVYPIGDSQWIAECGSELSGTGCSPLQAIANMTMRG